MAALTDEIKKYERMSKEELIGELLTRDARIDGLEKKIMQDQAGIRRLATVLRDSNDAITVQELDGTITAWNLGAEKMYGFSEQEAIGMNISDVVPDKYKQQALDLIKKIKTGGRVDSLETKRVTKDGRVLDVWLTLTKLVDDKDNVTAIATTERDVTGRKRMESELKEAAIKDQLTGLYNRRGFLIFTEKLLMQAERNNKKLILLYCDLDNLKEINDSFGHQTGDNAIKDFSEILKKSFRKSDILARMGGDEFAVLITDLKNKRTEEVIVRNIRESIKTHNTKAKRVYELNVSIGLSLFDPQNPCSSDELLSHADKVMYKEKRSRKYEGKSNYACL